MSATTKLVNLELDYELNEAESDDLKDMPQITRNLINQAFRENYSQGMGDKVAKTWRQIRKALDKAIEEDKCGFVLLSISDCESVCDEVRKCKYNPMMARFAPYLYDELDLVKNRSVEEEEKVQESMNVLKAAAERSSKDSLNPPSGSPTVSDIKEAAASTKK